MLPWDAFSFIGCGNRMTLGPQPQHVVRHSCLGLVDPAVESNQSLAQSSGDQDAGD